jgi:hypothetical protein
LGLETAAGTREIDVLLTANSEVSDHKIAVEMKCYKTNASSGKKRGATDIFMKDVYEDLARLETYVESGYANEGVALVMTDMKRLVHPRDRTAKCWQYDISHGVAFGPTVLNTPIGGKEVNITLRKHYTIEWLQHGPIWFLEVQGEHQPSVPPDALPAGPQVT